MSLIKQVANAVVVRWKWKPKPPAPVPAPVVDTTKPITYLLNDPGTPALSKQVQLPAAGGSPSFIVKDYQGGGFEPGTPQAQSAGCYYTMTGAINYYNSQTDKKLQKWATVPTLAVVPRAGKNLNAFYDRRSLQFFYYKDQRVGGFVYAADSTDIVAHELGHAILDAYRPDMWNAASLEVASFHECFGDFTAMMYALSIDDVIQFVIKETNGDLRKTSVVVRLAEQLGRAVYVLSGGKSGTAQYLRCAINDFKYVKPGDLPKQGTDAVLAAESHSFSRVFTGALYDILVMMYEDARSAGADPVAAVKLARDQITKYVLKAVQNAPINTRFYESMAKTILWADVTMAGRKYHDRMYEIFVRRNILVPQATILSAAPKCDNCENIKKFRHKLSLKLCQHTMRAQSHNPLYDVEVEIPHEHVYLYDNDKNLIDVVSVSHHQAVSAAQDMIEHLHATGKVSDDYRTPFEIKDGKLVRTHFDCGCGLCR